MDPDRWQSGSGAADVFSEGEVEGLVLPVVKVDGRGAAQDASCFQRPLRGGYSSSADGSSRPVSRRGVDGTRCERGRWNKHIRPSVGHEAWRGRPTRHRRARRRSSRWKPSPHQRLP